MITCCDTSFLFSLYASDAHSQRTMKYLEESSSLLTLTRFNHYELSNALHLSEFRSILPKGGAILHITNFEKDLFNERLIEASCNLATILSEAQRLSANYASKKGYRSFDIIHVAAALHLEAEIFLTFDAKQKELAKSQGLKVPI